jgi:hypothetical protein
VDESGQTDYLIGINELLQLCGFGSLHIRYSRPKSFRGALRFATILSLARYHRFA